jgi:hypothetical protein
MAGYALRAGIHHCFAGDYSIILDLKRDRYFALGDALHRTLKRLAEGVNDESDHANLEMLASRAILVGSDAPTQSLSPAHLSPYRDYRSTEKASGRVGATAALWSRIRVLAAYRCLSLETILARAVDRRDQKLATGRSGTIDVALAVSAAFRASDMLLAPQNRCLPRSIAMLDVLAAHGCPATLVIGVSSRPFMAHCWVEQSGVLLSDVIDNVQSYTPILVL